MQFKAAFVAVGILASTSALGMEVTVGKIPLQALESSGWTRVDSKTLKLQAPNGVTYQLIKGVAPLWERMDELSRRAKSLSKEERDEMAFLSEVLPKHTDDKNYDSTEICSGTLEFNPEFFFDMAGGAVNTTVVWNEFGPFGPTLKRIVATSKAWAPGFNTITRTSNSGWFSGQFYKSVSAYAGVSPTFQPHLTSLGYFYSYGCGSYSFRADSSL